MRAPLRSVAATLAAALVAGAGLAGPADAKTKLLVYTALEADQLKAYEAAFESAVPDVDIEWVRDSTGVVTAKLLAEKTNPKADVVWGLAATSLMLLDKEGMLEPYAPKELAAVAPKFRDAADPPAWVGMDVWASTLCFNTVEAGKANLPPPTSWADLTRPVYAGKVVMPNPASSGTGFLMVSSWLQLFGWDEGWAYMDKLHANAAVYTHSGSKPCKMAAAGEYPIGLSFEFRAAKLKADGAPIDMVFPKEGLGWDLEATAIVKGTKNLEAARKLADWAVTKQANELYSQSFAVVARADVASSVAGLPDDFATRLIANDFTFAATKREEILKEWSRRYDGKSEPKS